MLTSRSRRKTKPTGAFGGALYVQDTLQTIGILLCFKSYEATGGRSVVTIEAVVRTIIAALAGWAPPNAPVGFVFLRDRLVSMDAGTIVHQIDFSIIDQLRITP